MKNVAFLLPGAANIAALENARQGFMVANQFRQAQGLAPRFAVRLLASTPEVRLDQGRIQVQVDAVLEDAGPVDICIVPPLLAPGPEAIAEEAAMIAWLARHYKDGGELACLCVGAALPAAAGLLDGRQAVVHWAAQAAYAQWFPKVQWVCDRIVKEERGLYTSGGAFSAAHLVLHLIEKYSDRDTAIWCAKFFQLDWSRHTQLPFAVFMGHKAHHDEAVLAVQQHIESRYVEKLTVDALARRHAMGRRTLERRFRQATGTSIVEYLQRTRIEAAKKHLENSRKTVAEVMYEVGYNDSKAFRGIFVKYCGMSPVAYRERYLL
ncbi:GlxA family transcriptional regulator [Bordetella sp. 15P40C-2]|uniref:GlxA family transcriptional regulator n=1 Tax=Bordetella sp. 15P40C-2 TaxID=2572246 RepID=UPI00132A6732|nr:helix-turn-helix domain-containing protein [Bordetella sp. 15P40C-2]MVW69968.1 helix-turn-helix domain-containing protein [Bordetella sp. 15P40C-2]